MNAHRVFDQNELREVGKQLLSDGASVRLRLSGYSMFPFLRPHDIAIIEPIDASELKRGDVIVFCSEGRWIAHRLVGMNRQNGQRTLTAQGDSISKPDALIGEESLLGVIYKVERNGAVKTLDGPWTNTYKFLIIRLRPWLNIGFGLLLKIRNIYLNHVSL